MEETVYPRHCIVTCDGPCIEGLYHYGFIISLVASVLTCMVALYNVGMHFLNFNNPYFQSKIIIILFIAPAYCAPSTLSFLSLTSTAYLTLIRDFYESFALLAFVYLVFSYLAYDHENNQLNERRVYEVMKESNAQVPHQYPCSYFQKPYQLSSWRKAKFFSNRCKRLILQFILCKIVTTAFFAVVYPNYELRPRQSTDWDYVAYQEANTIIYWILTISSYVAYYYMSLLYGTLEKPLQPFRPDLKFATFNGIIFFTYWQKVWMVIFQDDILACFDSTAASYHQRKIMYAIQVMNTFIQHVLICLQMLVMIMAAAEAYSYQNYRLRTVRNMGSIRYIVVDIFTIFFNELRLFKPKRIGFTAETDARETELMTMGGRTSKAKCQVTMTHPLADCLRSDYF